MSGKSKRNAALPTDGGRGCRSGRDYRYTLIQWGVGQAQLYTDKLHRCFENIAAEKVASCTFSKRFPQARVIRCEHHYIFYLPLEGNPPRIFAVLHERMDLLARLKDRLG